MTSNSRQGSPPRLMAHQPIRSPTTLESPTRVHRPASVSGAAFQLDRLFVEVFEESAQDGSEINKVIVPVIYGPRIVAGYIGYRLHVVPRGDTLSKIARDHYRDPRRFNDILRAKPPVISNPNLIFPGQQLKIPIGA